MTPNAPARLAALVTVSATKYGRMMYLANDLYVGRSFMKYGEFSEGEVALFRAMLKPGMIVLDVGANIGAHTVVMAQMVWGEGGYVVAFEPMRYLAQLLAGNVALNGLTNVKVFQAACGKEQGRILVPAVDYTAEGENYGGLPLGEWEQGEKTPVFTIDSLKLPHLAFAKIDVEGMEQDVLEGARETIAEHRPVLYVEANPGDKRAPLLDYLMDDLEYDCWWSFPPLYNPNNWKHDPEDVYPGVVSHNVLCVPAEKKQDIRALAKVERAHYA